MPLDPSIALQIKQPENDPSKMLNSLANYQMAGAHSQLYNMQAQLQALKLNALSKVGQAMAGDDDNATQIAIEQLGTVDPEAAKTMQTVHQSKRVAIVGNQQAKQGSQNPESYNAFPDVKQTVTDTLAKQDANSRANTVQRLAIGGAAANRYLANPSQQAWDEGVNDMEKSGLYDPKEIAAFRAEKPNTLHAMRIQAAAQASRDYMETSGQAAGNQPKAVSPAESILAPNPTAPAAQPGGLPRASADGSATANSNPAEAKKALESDPRYQEVPKLALSPSNQPGVLHQGQDPAILAAKNASVEHYNKEIVPQGNAAAAQRAELGTIRSSLEGGKVSPGITAKLRETVAQFLYEGTGHNLKLAHDLTGIDPSTSETMNKSSLRLGFDMSRSQGAREAVQVITMALQANPNMMNTKEGALKLVDLLDKTAEWNVDRQDYAGKYFQKNEGHIIGFDSWHNQAHPVQQYTSQAVPYQIPRDAQQRLIPDKLQEGVTYEFPKSNPDGSPITEKGRPTMQKGRWDSKRQGFAHVEDE